MNNIDSKFDVGVENVFSICTYVMQCTISVVTDDTKDREKSPVSLKLMMVVMQNQSWISYYI